ncbi:hypothetical protein GCM10017691_47340 [Pseudonocardia petroleophila]|uniref:Membrane protein involved in the export of O-antigen and teichoic acid n=1 Tax=Pseudonocardia petroleophila TaxID=37331 RepID=A0A7G7MQL4_9PSEU|nr:hypothetical protein [Pseudonocardia petroleophila]QNG55075.1 hypothetical protein H6H00_15115 [Pseudonocardia petroleophila]
MVKIPAVARRAGWNLGDQMLVSLTNSILSFMVANSVDAPSFGGFSVAFTVFALVISGSRALATSPLNIRFSDVDAAESHRSAGHATGTALVIGFATGIGCGIAGLLLSGPASAALLALALVMPIVVVQDSYRYVFFSRGKPSAAALSDGMWTIAQLSSVAALLVLGMESVGLLLLVWGLSALAAVGVGIKQSGTWPDPRKAPAWFREHRDLTGYLFASAATAHGANQGAMLVIAGVGTVQALGSLRGAALILGPTSILSSAALSFAIPEFSRRRKTMTDRQWLIAAAGVSGAVAFLGLCWGAFFLLVPDQVGLFLLDETWQGTSEILFAAVVAQVFACGTIGPVVMLYAIDRASSTLPIQIVLGSLTFLGGVGGVTLAGAQGAQWGFALANLVVIPFWFFRLWRELKKRRDTLDKEAGLDPDPTVDDSAGAASRTPSAAHFMDDLSSAQMATMIMPRIEPRAPSPSPRPRPPVTAAAGDAAVDAEATQATVARTGSGVEATEVTHARTPSDAEATQATAARPPSPRPVGGPVAGEQGPVPSPTAPPLPADRRRPAPRPTGAPQPPSTAPPQPQPMRSGPAPARPGPYGPLTPGGPPPGGPGAPYGRPPGAPGTGPWQQGPGGPRPPAPRPGGPRPFAPQGPGPNGRGPQHPLPPNPGPPGAGPDGAGPRGPVPGHRGGPGPGRPGAPGRQGLGQQGPVPQGRPGPGGAPMPPRPVPRGPAPQGSDRPGPGQPGPGQHGPRPQGPHQQEPAPWPNGDRPAGPRPYPGPTARQGAEPAPAPRDDQPRPTGPAPSTGHRDEDRTGNGHPGRGATGTGNGNGHSGNGSRAGNGSGNGPANGNGHHGDARPGPVEPSAPHSGRDRVPSPDDGDQPEEPRRNGHPRP